MCGFYRLKKEGIQQAKSGLAMIVKRAARITLRKDSSLCTNTFQEKMTKVGLGRITWKL